MLNQIADDRQTGTPIQMRRSDVNTKLIGPASHGKIHPRWFRYISGQRLSLLIILLLLMFFALSSYVGSAKNHELLKKASQDRSVLIVSTGQLTDISKQEVVYIQKLLDIVEQQNKELKDAGQKIIIIPAAPGKPFILNPTNTAGPTAP
jgi:hypothetical protein